MDRKYFKPRSLTWLAGAGLISLGGILGVDSGYDLGGIADVIESWTGGIGSAVLIGQGAGLIGIRGMHG